MLEQADVDSRVLGGIEVIDNNYDIASQVVGEPIDNHKILVDKKGVDRMQNSIACTNFSRISTCFLIA